MRELAALLFVSAVCLCAPAEAIAQGLIPFRSGALHGYIDSTGREVIAPRFESAGSFSADGLAAVRVGGRYTFIRPDGTEAFDAHFDGVNDFSEGKAVVLAGGRFSVIDIRGQKLFDLPFSPAAGFREGRLLVMKNEYFGFVDEGGGVIVQPQYKEGGYSFADGFAPVRSEKRENGGTEVTWLYIGRDGRQAMDRVFALALPFSEGLAPVMSATVPKDGKRLWEYVDTSGRTVIGARFNNAHPFSEGLARVANFGKDQIARYAFIDRRGRVVIPYRFDYASDFHSGRAAVQVGGRWGYIDRSGRMVVPAIYESASDYVAGLAIVRKSSGKRAVDVFIDKSGKVVRQSSPDEGQ